MRRIKWAPKEKRHLENVTQFRSNAGIHNSSNKQTFGGFPGTKYYTALFLKDCLALNGAFKTNHYYVQKNT